LGAGRWTNNPGNCYETPSRGDQGPTWAVQPFDDDDYIYIIRMMKGDGYDHHLIMEAVSTLRDYTALYPRRLFKSRRRENLKAHTGVFYVYVRNVNVLTADWVSAGLFIYPRGSN
jgi:hypothetical protein